MVLNKIEKAMIEDDFIKEVDDCINTKNQYSHYLSGGNVTPKLIYQTFGDLYVVTQKQHGKSYVRFKLNNKVVATDVYSVGGSAQLTRVVAVDNIWNALLLKRIPTSESASGWADTTLSYGTSNSIVCRGLTSAVSGAYLEYDITVPHGVFSTTILAYQSNAATTNAKISIDGIDALVGVSLQGTPGWKEINVSITPGTHKIRITTVAAGYMTIAGVNKIELRDYKEGHSFDSYIVIADTNNPYITNAGAIDYAMVDADTGLYCGSYHGGELRNRLLYVLDGSTINITDNSHFIGRIFEIEQDTRIVNKLNAYSRYIFYVDSTQDFEVDFVGNINLSRLYTNMTTTHVNFTQCLYPKKLDVTNAGDYYFPNGTNYIIQKNPTSGQKLITLINNNVLKSTQNPYISSNAYYKKVYKANILTDTPYNLTSGNFKSSHIFE